MLSCISCCFVWVILLLLVNIIANVLSSIPLSLRTTLLINITIYCIHHSSTIVIYLAIFHPPSRYIFDPRGVMPGGALPPDGICRVYPPWTSCSLQPAARGPHEADDNKKIISPSTLFSISFLYDVVPLASFLYNGLFPFPVFWDDADDTLICFR